MKLTHTDVLMREKLAHADFDSFAILVHCGDEEAVLTSGNVDCDTYFDNASMGKVLVTAPLILKAVDRGLLRLDTTLCELFSGVPEEKRHITVQQLLTHSSGILRITIPDRVADSGKAAVIEHILDHPLGFAPGTDMVYSCNAYILLGYIIEKLYGDRLDRVYRKELALPLGLTRSRFNIALDEPNAAVCYRWKTPGKLRVDDENVYSLGGIAGNGASFTSLSDIRSYVEAVLAKSPVLYGKSLYDLAERDYTPTGTEGRGLGWLMVDGRYPQTGKLFPTGSFGHCGHCGHSFFMNRDRNLYMILLTNATRFENIRSGFHGYDYGKVMSMRAEVHNTVLLDLEENQ